jgi:hypothetical protein
VAAWVERRLVAARIVSAALCCAFLLLPLAGCATGRAAAPGSASAPSGAAPLDELWREYEIAVEDARYPRPERINRDLVAITTFADLLVWDDSRQKILMVTWATADKYPATGPMKLAGPAWLTAVPFVQRFCRGTELRGAALDVRLEQRIGLPPNAGKDAFVEMWVDPHDFFRPCPDPEVNDHECQVNLTTGTVERGGGCPWSAARQPRGQESGSFVKVESDHLRWMCDNWTSSYPPGNPRGSYPWTALGYTYDWAPASRDHVGDSEFVAPAGTPVDVRAVVPTARYCAPGS